MDPAQLTPNRIRNRLTLIVGEVNTGKTTLSRRILENWIAAGTEPGAPLILDLAPEIPAHIAAARGLSGVGGRLLPPVGHRVESHHPLIRPPRLSSKTPREALRVARENLAAIEAVLAEIGPAGSGSARPGPVFINDLSMYLQAGDPERLAGLLRSWPTVVANGYFGQSLGSGDLSDRERAGMEEILGQADRVIELTEVYGPPLRTSE